ncbi:extracellular solute-binding protein [Micromonospora peucetia]|uniref:Carbohydrate ABC transporter substrate-binding protein, CUT1 family n=1 Tax=Micromonospora peucetia TaxID=47871 RepID=A0A1C6U9K9_9ACTN|nr:extracellular solute-binding protein [Micromonospora peucetia]MCX4386324.1 extracellular solute-binding protein [Micromonospora peucetia]WSA33666.1 extracellular solute-binding protein [Micromonospora peucetia]SCL50648.1 carbohydrate ABC transporter substrate-binding protein, CUT1 family [Micromonospora peucetia]
MGHLTKRRLAVAIAAATALSTLVACGGSESEAEKAKEITFWTPQTTPQRVAAQEKVAARFTEKTGIKVKVVPLSETDQQQSLATGAASGDVPDVMLHSSNSTAAWRSQGLLNTKAAEEVVSDLGAETFNANALKAFSLDGKAGAVPSDGWVHLLVYRKDLLQAANVKVPTNLEEVATAATTMKATGVTGIALGTQSGTASGTEGIYSMFQSAGCQLVREGAVTIDSPECTRAAELFKVLRDSSRQGDFDVTSARAAYLAGKSSMLLFSTHILDELAGLDKANPPTCTQCKADPTFLSKNSGFITVLDRNHPAQYGATLGYGIPEGANTAGAKEFIKFMLEDGYSDTVASATEGRIPLRNGTKADPNAYLDAWGKLGIGPEAKSSVAELYGPEMVTQIRDGMNAVGLWGMGTKDSPLAGAVTAQGVLAQFLERLYAGESPAQVTKGMAEQVKKVQAEL